VSTDTCGGAQYINGAPIVLPETGTYTIQALPLGTDTGTATVAIFNVPPDPTASITAGGTLSQLSFTAPGQHGTFTFGGTSGQNVTLLLNFNGMVSGCYAYSVANPDGTSLVGSTFSCGGASYVNNAPIALPQTGTYSIAIVPSLGSSATSGTGTTTAAVFNVPADATGTLTAGSTPSQLTLTTPGQHGSFTFIGTSGQSTTQFLDFSGMVSGCFAYSVANPDGTVLVGSTLTCNTALYINSSPIILPQTGTYKIAVLPSLSGSTTSGTGTTKSTFFNVPADASTTLSVGGPSVPITISTPGQHGSFIFAGTVNQIVNVVLDTSQMTQCNVVSILNPDTTALVGSTRTCSNYSSGALTLPQTGNYTIAITPDLNSSTTSGTGTIAGSVAVTS
jgi:hypothetical protein